MTRALIPLAIVFLIAFVVGGLLFVRQQVAVKVALATAGVAPPKVNVASVEPQLAESCGDCHAVPNGSAAAPANPLTVRGE